MKLTDLEWDRAATDWLGVFAVAIAAQSVGFGRTIGTALASAVLVLVAWAIRR